MEWLQDAAIVTGLIILRTVVPVFITIGIGKLIRFLVAGRKHELVSDTGNSVAAARQNH